MALENIGWGQDSESRDCAQLPSLYSIHTGLLQYPTSSHPIPTLPPKSNSDGEAW